MQQPLGEMLPDKKFWVFATGADHDDAPYGLGLAHWLYWPVWFKRNGHKFWATYLERFGTPAVMGKYPPGTPEAEQLRLLQALAALRRDAAVTVPEGIAIELLEATRSGTADYAAFIAQMNTAILVAAIGQTASTQGTPGRLGNDQTQNAVRLDIVRADADLLSASFNRSVARWLTEWNFPGARTPGVWRIVEEPEDLKMRAERDKSIFEMGYRPTLRYIHETYGGEWEDAPSTQRAAAPVAGDGLGVGARFAEQFAAGESEGPLAFDQQALDDALAAIPPETLMRQAWEAAGPALRRVLAAGDYPTALGLIAELYPDMTDEGLEDLLARLLFAAQVWGALSADAELADERA